MPVFPIYILADRSASMAHAAGPVTAITVVNEVIRDLLASLSRDPTIRHQTRICLVSFADDATVDLPLTRLHSTTAVPELKASGPTSFAAAFDRLAAALRADLPVLGPHTDTMVFMLTDGQANSSRDVRCGWQSEYDAMLAAAGGAGRLRLIPFGFGQVHTATLTRLASDPAAAYISAHAAQPSEAIRRFGELILKSVVSSVVHGEPRTVAPPGSQVLGEPVEP
ncbi:hypothetical protein GCM10010112_26600 [Actinoplanes lobatus]|uniref:Uncharacterized protein YegL n=1 Tax=Actinoplanes lobatus TaxID=113568 RepID=A0A7W7HJH9_9ACTN|nr:VWA domain-containing protein [Actinoplanes lobatus]MBB4751701.1 uncharacterized protein YegL [Actinoplanes lobatus]GGN65336.1 hypothetical protein GCM10010112_26600 [Actinoplanes lobatus]GIE43284.1 hypothetical protein Alo02nite_61820 [Actinoplanes lobatus]